MAKKAEPKDTSIFIPEMEIAGARVAIIGETPLICNRMSEKAKRTILFPNAEGISRKTTAERAAAGEKHSPLQEYRDSPYLVPQGPTRIVIPATSIKKAMMTAALDTPGATKAKIGRLVRVRGEYIPVYGVPELHMSVVRSADINHTPDIRTRAVLRRWAMFVEVQWVEPAIRQESVVRLLSAAGMESGIGDWRQEKGGGDFGLFNLVSPDDPDLQQIMAEGGRDAQMNALEKPDFYDDETLSLYEWWSQAKPTGASRNGAKRGEPIPSA